jgi:hypothetical protein
MSYPRLRMTKNDVLTSFKAALQGIGYDEARVRRHYDFADYSNESTEVLRVPMVASNLECRLPGIVPWVRRF